MGKEMILTDLSQIFDNLGLTSDMETGYYYDILYDISTKILDKRLEMNMSQSEFADLLGVSQPMVSKYESGDYNFTIKQVCGLSAKLNLKPSFILSDCIPQDEFKYNSNIKTINLFTDERIEEAA